MNHDNDGRNNKRRKRPKFRLGEHPIGFSGRTLAWRRHRKERYFNNGPKTTFRPAVYSTASASR